MIGGLCDEKEIFTLIKYTLAHQPQLCFIVDLLIQHKFSYAIVIEVGEHEKRNQITLTNLRCMLVFPQSLRVSTFKRKALVFLGPSIYCIARFGIPYRLRPT